MNDERILEEYRGMKIGDKIRLHFAGGPTGMPLPWIIIDLREKFSSVNYKYNPSVMVEASNGRRMSFDRLDYYDAEKGV